MFLKKNAVELDRFYKFLSCFPERLRGIQFNLSIFYIQERPIAFLINMYLLLRNHFLGTLRMKQSTIFGKQLGKFTPLSFLYCLALLIIYLSGIGRIRKYMSKPKRDLDSSSDLWKESI